MAQFSGGGNKQQQQQQPWGRHMDMQPLVAFPNQGVYQQLPPGLAAMGAAVTGGGATPGSGAGPAASMSMHNQVNPAAYPRALAPAFGSQQMLQQQQQQAAAAAVASLQQGHPGLQGNNPHHPPPDRVLVEANYNTNMPFKWNASRIQVMPNNQRSAGSNGGGGVNPTATPNTLAFAPPALNNAPGPSNMKGLQQQQQQQIMNPNNKRNSDYLLDRTGGRNTHNNSSSSVNNRVNHSPPVRGGGGNSSRNLNVGGSLDKSGNDHGRDRRGRIEERSRFMDRDNDRGRDKDRGRSPLCRKRSRSPRRTRSRSRTRSPPRRRPRTSPRYHVFVPKISLYFPQSSIIDLKKRYGTMYVPSDFFASDHSWMDSFPMHQPLNIHSPALFHVFNKELVEPPIVSDAVYDPPDADHTYNVKVMLMASLPPEEFYEKTCLLADNGSRDNLIHPTRAIQFLVGLRGKNETMAIGGPWSPSLDGPDPEKDPSVLIKTAIRACRSLTGIDLSQCTQWHRFLEIHYRRLESSSRPARTETTVIFLPDVWSVMPTRNEFEELQTLYGDALNAKINPDFKKKTTEVQSSGNEDDKSTTSSAESKSNAEAQGKESKSNEVSQVSNKNEEMEESEVDEDKGKVETTTPEEKTPTEEEDLQTPPSLDNKDPSSWKDLDPKTMKVNDLRSELNARGLSSKGLKSQLVGRLTKELKQEQEKDESSSKMVIEEGVDEPEILEEKDGKKEQEKEESSPDEPEVMEVATTVAAAPTPQQQPAAAVTTVIKKKEPIKLDEKQKNALMNAYKLSSQRCIPVHPHPKAKSGKFDCTVMSLSVLLDYRSEDNKEGTFEVSLFAELFNEMLMRDAAFKIYKVIMDAVNKKSSPAKTTTDSKEPQTPSGGDSSSESKDEEGSSTKKKVVLDREALAAFSYFDQGHCGYLEVKEVEDIFYILNIDISRSQIKKLISKVLTSKDQLNYRGLIEQMEEDSESDERDQDKDKKLALGFRAFITGRAFSESTECQEEGVCVYKGKVVDVGKLLSQLSRSEKALLDTETNLNSTTKSLNELQHASEKFNSLKDKLNTEVKDLKKKVRSTEEELKKTQSNSVSYVATLKDIYSKVGPLVNVATKEESPITKDEECNNSSSSSTSSSNTPNGNSAVKNEPPLKNEK